MKIYTRGGDDGTTGLFGGQRTGKDDPRIECTGAIDELNAAIGLAAVCDGPIAPQLLVIQNELFAIGALLATPPDATAAAHLPPLEESAIARLEQQIDRAELVLSPLRQFILPGGCEQAARLHLARTFCRRAERIIVGFTRAQSVPPVIVRYLNRLSDYLFVAARLANHLAGVADVPWQK